MPSLAVSKKGKKTKIWTMHKDKPTPADHARAAKDLAEFLARCFHSAAKTLEWDAQAIRQAGLKQGGRK